MTAKEKTPNNEKAPSAEKKPADKKNNEGGKQNSKPRDNQKGWPEIKTGMVVRVNQKIKEVNPKGEEKERIQIFEGTVIGRKGGQGTSATITVRKISNGVGVEKIFPVHLPSIKKIEVIKTLKTRKSKLYYLKTYKKRLKERVKAK
jgi:large subunit ribosomal protein L19